MSNIFDSITSQNEQRSLSSSLAPVANDELLSPETNEGLVSDELSSTSLDVKRVTQELLRQGYIEESRKSDLFRKAIVHQDAIRSALEPLDLSLNVDDHRGVAFIKVVGLADDDRSVDQAWSHPLVRRQRLTLEQSLLIAILRQAFMAHEQESGVGGNPARITVEDLLPHYLTYVEDSGSDKKNESRLLNLLDQLKTHGIVSEVDKKQEVTIRPLIAHMADPASLEALLRDFQQQAELEKPSAGAGQFPLEASANE